MLHMTNELSQTGILLHSLKSVDDLSQIGNEYPFSLRIRLKLHLRHYIYMV